MDWVNQQEVTARIACDSQSKDVCNAPPSNPNPGASPAPPPPCASGLALYAFARAVIDDDFRLSRSEADSSAGMLTKRLLRERCIVMEVVHTCFNRYAGGDGMISRCEHGQAFVPCLGVERTGAA